jgi:hypothetical protein
MSYENFIIDTVFSLFNKNGPLQVPRDLSPEVKQPEHEADVRDG